MYSVSGILKQYIAKTNINFKNKQKYIKNELIRKVQKSERYSY